MSMFTITVRRKFLAGMSDFEVVSVAKTTQDNVRILRNVMNRIVQIGPNWPRIFGNINKVKNRVPARSHPDGILSPVLVMCL